MPTNNKLLACLVASATALCGAAGIALAEPPPFYEVRVLSTNPNPVGNETQKSRLKLFIERLRAELLVGNLGEANIGCDRCGELVESEKVEGLNSPNRPLVSLKFAALRNGSQLHAFVRSYDFVQASELGSTAFTMEIEGTSVPSSACSTAQLSLGCKTKSYCFQTGGCDKPGGGSCDLCPVQ